MTAKKSKNIYSFKEVLELCKDGHKHLLLGNGFSQGCFKDIFSYGSLLEKAKFDKLSKHIKDSFDQLGTNDFERVIHALQNASTLLPIYGKSNNKLALRIAKDAQTLKKILVDTIANNHPSDPSKILPAQYTSCQAFIRPFENIYTLNYDLLLYWVLMNSNSEGAKNSIKCDDGFRHPEADENEAEYVTWEITNTQKQNINYLIQEVK
jgi:hypothetical protein